MDTRWRGVVLGVALVAAIAAAIDLRVAAQQSQTPPGLPTEITQNRFNSGQSVIPYYEGWIKNADNTFDLVFGYFNRNFQEEFSIPAGPDNKVEPGAIDQGQPTYFLSRRQRFVYRVRVPADFGKKVLTWSITSHGRTEKAFADLIAPEEITERVVMTNGNFDPGLDDPNKPPQLKLSPVQNVTAGVPFTLTAAVTDDGLPKPRTPPAAPRPAPNTTTNAAFGAQVNSSGGGRPRGLSLSVLEYSGPAKVTYGGPVPVQNGEAKTTLTFAAPGTYKLMVTANDGQLSTKIPITITVTGSKTPAP